MSEEGASEENLVGLDAANRAVRGGSVGGLGVDLDVESPSLGLDEEKKLSEPKHGFEIGGSNSCECDVPELELDKGTIGRWRFQVVWCSECEYHFGSALELEELENGD